jgi:hypothetical protein
VIVRLSKISLLQLTWITIFVEHNHNHDNVDPDFGIGGTGGIPVPMDPGYIKGGPVNIGQGMIVVKL